MKVLHHVLVASTVDTGECVASRSYHFSVGNRNLIYWMGGWVGRRVRLDVIYESSLICELVARERYNLL
jgi:hypothetical protein